MCVCGLLWDISSRESSPPITALRMIGDGPTERCVCLTTAAWTHSALEMADRGSCTPEAGLTSWASFEVRGAQSQDAPVTRCSPGCVSHPAEDRKHTHFYSKTHRQTHMHASVTHSITQLYRNWFRMWFSSADEGQNVTAGPQIISAQLLLMFGGTLTRRDNQFFSIRRTLCVCVCLSNQGPKHGKSSSPPREDMSLVVSTKLYFHLRAWL